MTATPKIGAAPNTIWVKSVPLSIAKFLISSTMGHYMHQKAQKVKIFRIKASAHKSSIYYWRRPDHVL